MKHTLSIHQITNKLFTMFKLISVFSLLFLFPSAVYCEDITVVKADCDFTVTTTTDEAKEFKDRVAYLADALRDEYPIRDLGVRQMTKRSTVKFFGDCSNMLWLIRRGAFGSAEVPPSFVEVGPNLLEYINSMNELDVRTEHCSILEGKYNKEQILKYSDKILYCALGCKFTSVICSPPVRKPKIYLNTSAWVNWFVDEGIDAMAAKEATAYRIDPGIFEIWQELIPRLLSVFSCLIPITFNHFKGGSVWFVVGIVVYGIIVPLLSTPFVGVHNFIVALLCLMQNINSGHLFDSIIGFIPMILLFMSSFFISPVWQILSFSGAIILFLWYIWYSFFNRRQGSNAGFIVLILQVLVMYEQLVFVKQNYALYNFSGLVFEMFLNAIIPMGPKSHYLANAAWLAREAANRADWIDKYKGVLLFLSLQITAFLSVRAFLGAFYITALRYRINPVVILQGFLIYLCDAFGPINYARRLLLGKEKTNVRRNMYFFVAIVLNVSEFHYAFGFFMIRCVASVVDSVIIRSQYGRMTHQLAYNFNFNQQAFPQEKANAWVNGSLLYDIMQSVGKIKIYRRESNVMGVAFLSQHGHAKRLYTVKHVARDASYFTFKDVDFTDSVQWRKEREDDDDPIVSADLSSSDLIGAPIDNLVPGEVDQVDSLCFVTAADDGDPMINFVNHFSFAKDGTLRAAIDLKKGDSGGPVFALLKDGYIRFAGVVSKGSSDTGAGNIIACFLTTASDLSSDDDSVVLADPQAFNRARRIKVNSPMFVEIDYRKALMKYLKDDLCIFDTSIVPHYQALTGDLNALAERHTDMLKVVEIQEKEGSDDEEEGEPKAPKEKGKNRKARNKDKAARKRAYPILKEIYDILMQLRSFSSTGEVVAKFYEIASRSELGSEVLDEDNRPRAVEYPRSINFISNSDEFFIVVGEGLPRKKVLAAR